MIKQDLFHLLLKIANIYTLAHVWEVEIVDIGSLICILSFCGVKVFPQIRLGIRMV